MAVSDPDVLALGTVDWLRCERVVERFEEAWKRGPRPVLEEYLPAGRADFPAVLIELVHTDLEYRLRAGETARVEEYVDRFPELAAHSGVMVNLLAAEHDLRRCSEPNISWDQYGRRFPTLHAALLARAQASPAGGPLLPTYHRRPLGQDPQAVEERATPDGAHCAACGAPFRLDRGPLTSEPSAIRSLFGKYELLEVAGHGACGIVYRARDKELDRPVAIKIARLDTLAAPDEGARFVHEARSAAQLRHPNIVAVHDAGQTNGTYYLVSEFVPGMTLAQRLATGRLPIRQTAELLAQVAEALHYAHERGVIHRDIKPSNLLLDAEGRPHLTDFGLAKRRGTEATLTLDGQVLGTPAYMSPEQARGEARCVDGRTDIYSLGVVLYELLTGKLPFQGNGRMVLIQVLEEEPRSPRRLDDSIPRDLENICLKAMAKEPRGRYPTAAALAEDLRRFLRGQPVQARPLGRLVLLGRWCRRKPVLAGLLAALGLVLGLGFAGVAWQGHRAETNLAEARYQHERAERSFRQAHQAVHDLTHLNHMSLLAAPGLRPLHKELLEKSLKYYQDFLDQRGDDPALQMEAGWAFHEVANLYLAMNLKVEALAAFHKAVAIGEKLVREQSASSDARFMLATCYDNLADFQRDRGHATAALRAYQKSHALADLLVRDNPTNIGFNALLARGCCGIGLAYLRAGRLLEALRMHEQACARLEKLVPERGDWMLRRLLGQSYYYSASVQVQLGRPAEALCAFQRAARLFKQFPRDQSITPNAIRDLAASFHNIGRLQAEGKHPDEAVRSYQEALALRQKLVRDHPENPNHRSDLSGTWQRLGETLEQLGRLPEARAAYRHSRDLQGPPADGKPARSR